LRICLLVATEYTNVTDRRTPHNGTGLAYASCGKNSVNCVIIATG